jgi:hypothetical protein
VEFSSLSGLITEPCSIPAKALSLLMIKISSACSRPAQCAFVQDRRQIEAAYEMMMARRLRGEAPQGFAVAPS